MKKKIKIENDFHNTEVTCFAEYEVGAGYWLNNSQIKRTKKVLCGYDGCSCGDSVGQRFTHGNGWKVEPHPDGAWLFKK